MPTKAPRRPVLVVASAVLLALSGVAGLFIGLRGDAAFLFLGGGYVLVGVAVWRGVSLARLVGVAAGLLALLPGAYGIFGTIVVVQEYAACSSGALAATTTASYPAGYCDLVNWVSQFGTGGALIGVGIGGIVTLVAVTRHHDFFTR